MRRTALYLGGLFLATGATLAMAAPAQAADGKCKGDYVAAGYGYASYATPVAVVPVGGYSTGYGYDNGGIYNSRIKSNSINQYGGGLLGNIALQDINVLSLGGSGSY